MGEQSQVDTGSEDNSTDTSSITDKKNDTVAYSTYKKVLSQEKNLRVRLEESNSKLAALEEEKNKAEEAKLSEQGEYKKLLELERKKREESELKAKEYENSIMNAHKLNAFKEKLPSKIANPAYYDFVEIDKIVIDPETGLVNDSSVQEVVDSFVSNHAQLLESRTTGLPNDAAKGSPKKITIEEWKRLPLSERKARMKEVYDTIS